MEGLHQAVPPRGETLNSQLKYLCAPCIGRLMSTRYCRAIAIIIACAFCLMIFNMRDNTNLSPVSIPYQNIGGFRIRDSDRRALQPTRDVRIVHNDPGTTCAKDGQTQKFPNVIIIGARKAGTRALLEYLGIHPQVVKVSKEMHFFSNKTNYAKGMEWYRAQMPFSEPGQLTIEKTPKYMISKVAPKRVHRMNSSILLLLTLRHPVTRAISDYLQERLLRNSQGLVTEDFVTSAIDNRTGEVKNNYKAITISTYHLHVARWLEMFSLNQIHFIDGDRLITNPLEELRPVETFLGLDHFYNQDNIYFNATRGFPCMRKQVNGITENSCLGASKGRKHPHVEMWVKNKLNQYFYKHNEKLFKMIGRSFDWT